MAPSPITVLVADDQPLFRDAMARIVRQQVGLQLCDELAEGREALAAIRAQAPDVAVLQEDLPGLSGAAIARAVLRDDLPTRVVLLAVSMRSQAAYEALAAGACGFLPKTASADEVRHAIVSVASGEAVIAPAVQAGIVREIRLRARGSGPALTPRERQILVAISAGKTAPEIGRELHLGTATVKTHMLHLYDKLEVSERAAAVAQAMRRGLLE